MKMKKYGLIGKTLSHSFSKLFFEDFFRKNQIDAKYSNIELNNIYEIDKLFTSNYNGLNVTIPFKEKIIPFLDELSKEANNIGAVNTIQFKSGKKIGYNTDIFGFKNSVKPFITNRHERAIIFGTGGASKAVNFVLNSMGIDVIFISRNPKNENEFSYNNMNKDMINSCKMLVNCTPIGTYPNIDEQFNLPYNYLSVDHLVVDLIYNPSKTVLLKKAEEQGAVILNGYSMLKEQALKSWSIWNS
tara:strand:- start:1024 stop:1755 length:732 start_codon:yes stop_codon:yes gene_type:complete